MGGTGSARKRWVRQAIRQTMQDSIDKVHTIGQHVNRRNRMKRNIWLAAGIAGMLLGQPPVDARAEVNVQISAGNRPAFVMDRRPNFIDLKNLGFSVSIGGPYDIIFYGNRYYLYQGNRWYRSSSYRGPWVVIRTNRIPLQIRKHRWDDIRRYRDVEYGRRDNRFDWYYRDQNNRDNRNDQRNDNYRDNRNDQRNDNNRDNRNDRNRTDNDGRRNDGGKKN
jgi:hypothetical protein